MMQVQKLALESASVYVTMKPWGELEKEEIYFNFTGEWLKKPVKFTVVANRYMASHFDGERSEDRLTTWRTWVAHGAPSETARERMSHQTEATVWQWIDSNLYEVERRKAYINAVKRIVAEERFDTKRPAAVIERHANEMGDKATNQLRRAVGLLSDYFAVLAEVA